MLFGTITILTTSWSVAYLRFTRIRPNVNYRKEEKFKVVQSAWFLLFFTTQESTAETSYRNFFGIYVKKDASRIAWIVALKKLELR